MAGRKPLAGRRKMTPAQKQKRHDIAEDIHAEHPGMPMAQKFKIATAAAMGRTKRRKRGKSAY